MRTFPLGNRLTTKKEQNISKNHDHQLKKKKKKKLSTRMGALTALLRSSHPFQLLTATVCLAGLIGLFTAYTQNRRGLFCRSKGGEPTTAYSIVIDAGSSHSTAVLYRFTAPSAGKKNNNKTSPNPSSSPGVDPHLRQVTSCSVGKGITSGYDGDYDRAGEELADCVRHHLLPAVHCSVPAGHVALYLASTAGVRVMALERPKEPVRLFQAVRRRLEATGVAVKLVDVIGGDEEGLYAWVAANYLSGQLLPPKSGSKGGGGSANQQSTAGIIELGGASLQIAHELPLTADPSTAPPMRHVLQRNLFGSAHTVQSVSHLCYGADEAFRRYLAIRLQERDRAGGGGGDESAAAGAVGGANLSVACLPRGLLTTTAVFRLDTPCNQLQSEVVPADAPPTQRPPKPKPRPVPVGLVGTGDYEQCLKEITSEVLAAGASCSSQGFAHCPSTEQLVFRRAEVPHYYALGAYVKATASLGLVEKDGGRGGGTSRVQHAAFTRTAEKVCSSRSWPKDLPPVKAKFVPLFCWRLALIAASLRLRFQFETVDWDSGRLRFEEKIGGKDVNWALGLAVVSASEYSLPATEPGPGPGPGPEKPKGGGVLTLILLLLVAGLGLLLVFGATVSLVVLFLTLKAEGVSFPWPRFRRRQQQQGRSDSYSRGGSGSSMTTTKTTIKRGGARSKYNPPLGGTSSAISGQATGQPPPTSSNVTQAARPKGLGKISAPLPSASGR